MEVWECALSAEVEDAGAAEVSLAGWEGASPPKKNEGAILEEWKRMLVNSVLKSPPS